MSDQERIKAIKERSKNSTFWAVSLGDIENLLARIQELEAENTRLKADPAEVQKYWNRLTRIEITTPAPTPEPREG